MIRHFIVSLALSVFFLISFGVFQLLAVRFLLDLRSVTLKLGFGQPVFLLHLNRLSYHSGVDMVAALLQSREPVVLGVQQPESVELQLRRSGHGAKC